jgi:hypothetical protein
VTDLDHLAGDPWHRFVIAADHGISRTLTHPDDCPRRCHLGRLHMATTEPASLTTLTTDLPFGEYRLRWTPRGIEVQHPDGTDVDGARPTPPAPVVLAEAEMAALAAAADEALNAYHHADQCGCDTWPTECASTYFPGLWDTSAWYPALPALLATWAQLRPAQGAAE